VKGLNIAKWLRSLCPDTGLTWCSDLDFSLQSYDLDADYFLLMERLSREAFESGLTRWKKHVEESKNRGYDQ